MTLNFLIGGDFVAAEAGATFDRHDPVTGEIATTAAAASISDALKAVASAQAAFAEWSATGPEARRKLLMKAADIMEARNADFVASMVKETGATTIWAGFNAHLAAGMLREAGAMTTQIGGEVIPANKPGTLAMAVAKPKGVCLGIAPWNAPVILGTRAVAMALACGNTVVLKSSELCPRTHRLIGECLNEAGLPKGAINVISNAPADAAAVVKALIEAPEVRHVNFTGSTGVGRIIGRLAGENLKPALLELGGKAPLVILEDADLEGAVNAAIFGSFMNQGQICMSTERIIVVDAMADAFVEALAKRAAALPHGDPRGKVVLGSLVTEASAEKMDALIADATAKGATLVAGGTRTGAIHSATLLDGVTPDMRIYAEESFGPVKSIIRVRDTDEAVRVANDTEYGLSAAVFSQDITRAFEVANRIESGICHINGPTVSDEPQMPFGGVKASGYGRFGGKAGIAEFTDLRWITVENPKQHYPF
ncbi:aldehyde dehydrogenase [Celeribacter baekdonensis]|uniref:Salicylaldehyde dehydrogenase n=1 Tax=Celeribacter baekdonensis TaxID=875171 RepID=A0A2R4LXY0_9RHOB|nr:aldehyde dehydrogenase [Celeribacter baekdonensis]AVW89743.1 salicylaldehyde dehydrogenase [Celeribacter baekdonensis]|tara:strand:- start:52696 stop:54141 length:1446 start_codon:yes stop_codon:yes gene_type:complete